MTPLLRYAQPGPPGHWSPTNRYSIAQLVLRERLLEEQVPELAVELLVLVVGDLEHAVLDPERVLVVLPEVAPLDLHDPAVQVLAVEQAGPSPLRRLGGRLGRREGRRSDTIMTRAIIPLNQRIGELTPLSRKDVANHRTSKVRAGSGQLPALAVLAADERLGLGGVRGLRAWRRPIRASCRCGRRRCPGGWPRSASRSTRSRRGSLPPVLQAWIHSAWWPSDLGINGSGGLKSCEFLLGQQHQCCRSRPGASPWSRRTGRRCPTWGSSPSWTRSGLSSP